MNIQKSCIGVILACLSFAHLSYAAIIQLPVTGQVKCYDSSDKVIDCVESGQDGDVQAGVAWPVPRFTDNSIATVTDLSVTDNLTGLIWAQNGNLAGDTISWQAALNYIKGLNTNFYLGHNDWRLPNRNELESLVNKQVPDQSVWLNLQGFKNIQRNYYWSSSTDLDSSYYPGRAWNVYMWSGYLNRADKTYKQYFLPVRTGQVAGTISLPATGQTSCYSELRVLRSCTDTGEDGEKLAGVAWPSPRFTDNSVTIPADMTLTDNLTGLTWTKNAYLAGVTKSWQDALTYIQGLNSSAYLGYNDWRLPNRNELQSLINVQYESQVDWLQGQGFVNVAGDEYWSSSTSVKTSDNYILAWHVNMRYGLVFDFYSKPHTYYVWPVRSVQIVPMSQLTVTVSGSGGGTISSAPQGTNPTGVSCTAGTCTTTYPATTTITLTATPDPVSTFGVWGDACSNSGACGFVMDTDKSVTATFIQAPLAKNNSTQETYPTLAEAITKANPLIREEIRLLGTPYDGAVSLAKAIYLNGGWKATYGDKSSVPTTLNGGLTIGSGDSQVDSVLVLGNLTVSGGSLRVKDVKVR